MRLDQDAVDVVDVDGLFAGANGVEHAGEAQVAGFAQDAIGRANDQVERALRERVVPQAKAVEFYEKGCKYNDPGGCLALGITLLSAENLRTGNVWKWFMANPEIPRALNRIGLEKQP